MAIHTLEPMPLAFYCFFFFFFNWIVCCLNSKTSSAFYREAWVPCLQSWATETTLIKTTEPFKAPGRTGNARAVRERWSRPWVTRNETVQSGAHLDLRQIYLEKGNDQGTSHHHEWLVFFKIHKHFWHIYLKEKPTTYWLAALRECEMNWRRSSYNWTSPQGQSLSETSL